MGKALADVRASLEAVAQLRLAAVNEPGVDPGFDTQTSLLAGARTRIDEELLRETNLELRGEVAVLLGDLGDVADSAPRAKALETFTARVGAAIGAVEFALARTETGSPEYRIWNSLDRANEEGQAANALLKDLPKEGRRREPERRSRMGEAGVRLAVGAAHLECAAGLVSDGADQQSLLEASSTLRDLAHQLLQNQSDAGPARAEIESQLKKAEVARPSREHRPPNTLFTGWGGELSLAPSDLKGARRAGGPRARAIDQARRNEIVSIDAARFKQALERVLREALHNPLAHPNLERLSDHVDILAHIPKAENGFAVAVARSGGLLSPEMVTGHAWPGDDGFVYAECQVTDGPLASHGEKYRLLIPSSFTPSQLFPGEPERLRDHFRGDPAIQYSVGPSSPASFIETQRAVRTSPVEGDWMNDT
jgi:hypothetical protein